MDLGIDTASYQGAPNWAAVAGAGITYAYVKASEGGSASYPTTTAQFQGARGAGLAAGLYHYAKPALSAEANAASLAAQVNRLHACGDGFLPPCLDLEEGSGNLAGWARRFVAKLRALTGCTKVMVYSGGSFFIEHIGEGWMDDAISLWIAHYGRPAGSPAYHSPRVALHQYSSTGQVPGIAGHVDLSAAIWPLARLVSTTTSTEEDDQMTPEMTARLDRLEHGLGLLVQQVCGEGATLDNPWPGGDKGGWATKRWAGQQERLSLVDYVRAIDRQVNSALDLGGRPGGPNDNDFGHLLSLRAEVRALGALLSGGPKS